MKNDEKNESDLGKATAAERLTDSLLKNYAANPEGADDEEFLAGVEAAMDSEDGGHSEFATAEVSEFPEPSARRSRGRRLGWATGIAAALAIGITVTAVNLRSGAIHEDRPAQIVATTGQDFASDHIEQQRVPRVQRRPSTAATSTSLAEVSYPSTAEELGKDSFSYDRSDIAIPAVKPLPEFDSLSLKPMSKTERGYAMGPAEGALPYVSTSSGDSGFGMSMAGFGDPDRLSSTPAENSAARYGEIIDNRWNSPLHQPLSTFSIDVDTASWTNIRGMLERGVSLGDIPRDAVRIEEMINYFSWNYPQPDGKHPFGYAVESASCPWNADNRLLRIGIQGKDIKRHKRPPANLVFLLDVSGSMNQPDKLPLVQRAISILVEELNEDDCVSIVVYAGSEGVALETTRGNQQHRILAALNRLQAGGSTNGGAGIDLAYKLAARNFNPKGVNRVILCTDGDFNVGLTGQESLVEFVEGKAKRDRVFLSVCGFGDDNLNDAMLEAITNKGNGNYYYIDSAAEARKVFLKDLTGTLVTIAKDVKIQVEFNPGQVKAYRLIGYANRQLAAKDFEDDRVDAGEIGAGHSVTALYEIVPAGGVEDPARTTSNLRYQKDIAPEPQPKRRIVPSPELALLKLRYKKPDEDISSFVQYSVMPNDRDWRRASADFRFASAVALFGLKLRDHESARGTELADVIDIAEDAAGNDPHGYREAFVKLLKQARE